MELFKKADWIWLDGYDSVNTYVTFYDCVSLPIKKETYKFLISVDTNYALYINGKQAGTGQYADYPFDKVYDELESLLNDALSETNDYAFVEGMKVAIAITEKKYNPVL